MYICVYVIARYVYACVQIMYVTSIFKRRPGAGMIFFGRTGRGVKLEGPSSWFRRPADLPDASTGQSGSAPGVDHICCVCNLLLLLGC